MAKNPKMQSAQNTMKGRAILFELETVAVDGRKMLYDTIRRILKAEGCNATQADYSRFFLDRPLAVGLERYAADHKPDMQVAKLSEQVEADIQAWATGGRLSLNPVLTDWLKRRQASQVRMGTLCCMGAVVAEALSAALGLKAQGDDVPTLALDGRRPLSADAWLKLAKQLKVVPPLCVVVASSMKSAKAAIAAGMHCVVIEDGFNAFQDFGGVDYVVDALSSDILDQAFALTWKL